MRPTFRLNVARIALAASCIVPVSVHAQTQAVSFGSGASAGTNSDQSVGWQFNVLSGITVDGLGWYDFGFDGLSLGRTVGIWSPSGTLLMSVFVPGGTTAALNGQFRTVSVADFFLTPGNGYIIGGQNFANATDFLAFNPSSITVNPSIQFVDATFSDFSATLVRPTQFSAAETGFFGPGFTIGAVTTTPEPGTYAMVATGLLFLAFVHWRRRTSRGASTHGI
jgi:hypothetical protein